MPLALLLRLQAEPVSTAPSGPDLSRYFLVCGGLLVLVLLLAHVFRRAFGRALAARAARRSLRVVDVLPLGGSKRLVVVHCYERVFLVGQGDKELCVIAELDSEATTREKDGPAPAAAARSDAFARTLEGTVARSNGAANGASAASEASEMQPAPRRDARDVRALRAELERGRGILG